MKKTANASSKKLSLNVQTIRTLTSQDLTLVIGGVCQHGSNPSAIVPAPLNRNNTTGGNIAAPTTC